MFQLVSDEAHKDGVVDAWEERMLGLLARQLSLAQATALEIMELSRKKFEQGKLGSSRRLDPKVAYCKVLYFMHHGGVSPDGEPRLALLRQLFGFSEEDHQVLMDFVKAKL